MFFLHSMGVNLSAGRPVPNPETTPGGRPGEGPGPWARCQLTGQASSIQRPSHDHHPYDHHPCINIYIYVYVYVYIKISIYVYI